MNVNEILPLEQKIGYQFRDRDLLRQSLTHKSFHNEFPEESSGNNERLEFLGDAVLDLILSEKLMEKYTDKDEGFLSVERAHFVAEPMLVVLAQDYHLDEWIRLGRGEKKTHGATKPRLLSSAFEALIGALYQDAGYERCKEVVVAMFAELLSGEREVSFVEDSKSALQALSQEKYKSVPVYKLEASEGPDHEKEFFVSVWVNDVRRADGKGRTKKVAEQQAAKIAIEKWESQNG